MLTASTSCPADSRSMTGRHEWWERKNGWTRRTGSPAPARRDGDGRCLRVNGVMTPHSRADPRVCPAPATRVVASPLRRHCGRAVVGAGAGAQNDPMRLLGGRLVLALALPVASMSVLAPAVAEPAGQPTVP